jgi:hypothetical protein
LGELHRTLGQWRTDDTEAVPTSGAHIAYDAGTGVFTFALEGLPTSRAGFTREIGEDEGVFQLRTDVNGAEQEVGLLLYGNTISAVV